jgi:uncharacterized protein YlxW (UPF0749 family)
MSGGGEQRVGADPPAERRQPRPGAHDEEFEASSSVLGELIRQAQDDGYSLAAAQPGGVKRGGVWMWGFIISVILVGTMLTVAAIQTREDRPEVAQEKSDLIEQIRDHAKHVDQLEAQAAGYQESITDLQDQLLQGTEDGKELSHQLANLDVLAGAGKVAGGGMRIVVDNAPEGGDVTDPDSAKGDILDIDLQQAVNGLWSAGAEAITINGQRMTSLTAIRNAGESITVNYRPLARPYTIEAIGDPDTLPGRFAESQGGEWLYLLKAQQNIRLELFSVDKLTLNGISTSQLRYAQTEGS